MSKAKTPATSPMVIDDSNLSRAWARLFLQIHDNAGTEVAPLILSLSGFAENGVAVEDPTVRQSLDELLKLKKQYPVENVAFTIFPQSCWKISCGDRTRLFTLYRKTFPRLQARNPKANGRGLYFERLIMYGCGPCNGNQLEWILSQFRKGVRRSMFQATTFDPCRDHVANARLGFPCMQQVSFVPTEAGLVTNAFYATQQVFDKAYGNYLGLVRLGAFMAHEMNMPLARLNVMVGVAKLERINKGDPELTPVIKAAKSHVAANPDEVSDPAVSSTILGVAH